MSDMDDKRFKLVFEEVARLTASDWGEAQSEGSDLEFQAEFDEIAELRRLALCDPDPEPLTFTST